MKKKLEADLMSIAHSVLQMKNKSDINQLFILTQRLYEKLVVLRFIEEQFGEARPTIGKSEIVEKISSIFDEAFTTNPVETIHEISPEPILVPDTVSVIAEQPSSTTDNEISNETNSEPTVEEVAENEQLLVESEPAVEDSKLDTLEDVEEPAFNEAPKKEAVEISFDDFFATDYSQNLFVKVENQTTTTETVFDFELPKTDSFKEEDKNYTLPTINDIKSVSLNDKIVQGFSIDLNDRMGFVKNLFGNNLEDYNRVLNQLITYESLAEAKFFLNEMVKPDYNNWEGKEDYEKRFMQIITKKFS